MGGGDHHLRHVHGDQLSRAAIAPPRRDHVRHRRRRYLQEGHQQGQMEQGGGGDQRMDC